MLALLSGACAPGKGSACTCMVYTAVCHTSEAFRFKEGLTDGSHGIIPLSSEYATYKTVKARFWAWLSDKRLETLFRLCLVADQSRALQALTWPTRVFVFPFQHHGVLARVGTDEQRLEKGTPADNLRIFF